MNAVNQIAQSSPTHLSFSPDTSVKTAIIIDDESHAIASLAYELKNHCPDVKLIAVTTQPEEGLSLIEELNPDIVFLDIEMPWMSGFEILQNLKEVNFGLIFVTAFDQYAIQAIKFSAIDYLLKPVSGKDLSEAVNRVKKIKEQVREQQLDVLMSNLSKPIDKIEKLVLPTNEGLEFINIVDIIRCESDSNYTRIYLKDKQQIFLAKTLKEFENLLGEHSFIRVHNSHLISEKHIAKYYKADGGSIQMSDGSTIPLSRNKKVHFLDRYKNL